MEWKEQQKSDWSNIEWIAVKHSILYSALQRLTRTEISAEAIVNASEGHGWHQWLTVDEEQLILDCSIEFQHNGTRLDSKFFRVLQKHW